MNWIVQSLNIMLLRKRHQFHMINMQKALAICQIHAQEVKNRITQQTAVKWWYNSNVMVTLHQYSLHRAFPSPYLGFLAILPPTVFIVHHPAPDIVSLPLCTYHCSLLPYNILFLTSATRPASFDQPAHSSTVHSSFISPWYLSPEYPQRHTLLSSASALQLHPIYKLPPLN